MRYEKTTIFVDNNIPSGLAFGNWANPQDEDPVKKLWKMETVIFYTSITCKQEAISIPNDWKRQKILAYYEKIELVPSRPTLSYGHVDFNRGHSTQDVTSSKLRRIFKNKTHKGFKADPNNDADHIFEASMVPCGFFLTVDRKTLINVYQKNKTEVQALIGNMEIIDPPTLWGVIGN